MGLPQDAPNGDFHGENDDQLMINHHFIIFHRWISHHFQVRPRCHFRWDPTASNDSWLAAWVHPPGCRLSVRPRFVGDVSNLLWFKSRCFQNIISYAEKTYIREFPAGFSSSEKILLKYKWPVTNPPVFIKINQGQVMPRAQLLSSRTQSSARRSSPRRRGRCSWPRGPRGPRGPQGGWELQTCPWKLQTCPKIWRFLLLLQQQQQHRHVEISWSIPRL